MTDNKLGLPEKGADPNELFNNEEKEVEVQASDEKLTETATSTDVEIETKTETPAEAAIPAELTNDQKLELGRQEFGKFLAQTNPVAAEELARQNKTGKAGYQQALAYANVSNPEVVEQWRNEGMLQKAVTNNQSDNNIQGQPADSEFDPYDKNQMMNLMMTAIDTTDKQKHQNQQQQYQQSVDNQVKAEAEEVYNQFHSLELNIKTQLGEELGGKILADAYTKVNSYGIEIGKLGGAMNYANAFNDQLTIALDRHNAELNKNKVATEQSAKISENLKKTMLQTQPAGSASDEAALTPKQKHLAKLQSRKELSVSDSMKQLNK